MNNCVPKSSIGGESFGWLPLVFCGGYVDRIVVQFENLELCYRLRGEGSSLVSGRYDALGTNFQHGRISPPSPHPPSCFHTSTAEAHFLSRYEAKLHVH